MQGLVQQSHLQQQIGQPRAQIGAGLLRVLSLQALDMAQRTVVQLDGPLLLLGAAGALGVGERQPRPHRQLVRTDLSVAVHIAGRLGPLLLPFQLPGPVQQRGGTLCGAPGVTEVARRGQHGRDDHRAHEQPPVQ